MDMILFSFTMMVSAYSPILAFLTNLENVFVMPPRKSH